MSMRRRSLSLAFSTSTPNSLIVPDCLCTRPRMVRRRTDLPAPEAPTKPRISPRRIWSDKLSRMTLSAKETVMSCAESTISSSSALCVVVVGFVPSSAMSELDRCVEHGEKPVEDDHHEDRLHHRSSHVLPERFGAAADLHAFDRGDRADDHGHERRLDQPGKDCAEIDGNAQPVDEGGRCDVGVEPCRQY